MSVALTPYISERLRAAKGAVDNKFLSELLLLSEQQLTKLQHRAVRPLPSFKINSSRRYDPRAVEQWLRAEIGEAQ